MTLEPEKLISHTHIKNTFLIKASYTCTCSVVKSRYDVVVNLVIELSPFYHVAHEV